MQNMPTDADEGLFEHSPGKHYLHLLREVIVTYRLFLRRLAADVGVTVAQLEVLRQLALTGGRSTTSALARELGVDPAAVTRLVADLETLELVTRERDARDGRRRPVVLTERGRRETVTLHELLHEREGGLADALDDADLETAVRVLQTVRRAFDVGALGVGKRDER